MMHDPVATKDTPSLCQRPYSFSLFAWTHCQSFDRLKRGAALRLEPTLSKAERTTDSGARTDRNPRDGLSAHSLLPVGWSVVLFGEVELGELAEELDGPAVVGAGGFDFVVDAAQVYPFAMEADLGVRYTCRAMSLL